MHNDVANRIHKDLKNLGRFTRQTIASDSGPHVLHRDKGILKRSLCLFYNPQITIQGIGVERKAYHQNGEWFSKKCCEKKQIDRFLETMIIGSTPFQEALEGLKGLFQDIQTEPYAPEVYLTLFSYKLLTELLNEQSDNQLDGLCQRFLQDLESRNLLISGAIGIDGIGITEREVVLADFGVCRYLLRQVEREDFEKPILVKAGWDGDPNEVNRPEIQIPASFLVFEDRHTRLISLGDGMFRWSLHVQNRILGYLIEHIRVQLKRGLTILTLFQSKAMPRMRSLGCEFYLDDVSSQEPIYTFGRALERGPEVPTDPFFVSRQNAMQLANLWHKLMRARHWERIFESSLASPDEEARLSRPAAFAFSKYLAIIPCDMNVEERIFTAVSALEALFTPKQYRKKSKIFMPRLAKLLRLYHLDPNDTLDILGDAWKVRSKYVHRGAGWDDRYSSDRKWRKLSEDERLQLAVAEDRCRDVAQVVLDYLRIAIVARITVEEDDREFLRLLDALDVEQESKLKSELEWLPDVVSGAPVKKIQWGYLDFILALKGNVSKRDYAPWGAFFEDMGNDKNIGFDVRRSMRMLTLYVSFSNLGGTSPVAIEETGRAKLIYYGEGNRKHPEQIDPDHAIKVREFLGADAVTQYIESESATEITSKLRGVVQILSN